MKRRSFFLSSLLLASTTSLRQIRSINRPSRGIKVADGENRKHQILTIGSAKIDFKLSGEDTEGDLCFLVSSNNVKGEPVPMHVHPQQDETFFVLEGQIKVKIGEELFYLNPGDHLFAPRKIPHAWVSNSEIPSKVLIGAQPAGKLEGFFQALSKLEKITPALASELYEAHGMQLIGPPIEPD